MRIDQEQDVKELLFGFPIVNLGDSYLQAVKTSWRGSNYMSILVRVLATTFASFFIYCPVLYYSLSSHNWSPHAAHAASLQPVFTCVIPVISHSDHMIQGQSQQALYPDL